MAERPDAEAALREARRASERLVGAAAEAAAAAGQLESRVAQGAVSPDEIKKQVEREVARGNVARRGGRVQSDPARQAEEIGRSERRLSDVYRRDDVAAAYKQREQALQRFINLQQRAQSLVYARRAGQALGTIPGGDLSKLVPAGTTETTSRYGARRVTDPQTLDLLRRQMERAGFDPGARGLGTGTGPLSAKSIKEAQAAASEAKKALTADVRDPSQKTLFGQVEQEARRATRETRRAAQEITRTTRQLRPRASAGGGGRAVVAAIAEQEVAATRRAEAEKTTAVAQGEQQRRALRAGGHAQYMRTLDSMFAEASRREERIGGGAAGGGGRGGGGRPPIITGGGGGGGREDDEHRQNLQRSRQVEEQAIQTQARMRSSFQATSVTLGSQSDVLRRHGALTTEFIEAAARGETTFRELGFQAGATIGKFAGWLGAGAAVFFAVDAIKELYRGAVDAESGVQNLSRVISNLDRDSARGAVRGLASDFNVPIKDASDAAFEMGKVFHDQNDAFKATRAVLGSVKVGELEVADASRFLIAIINGFQLPASDMAIVFDQINQAQNKFGVSIRDTEAGVAKAAGTFKAAGGDMTTLLALITTGQKVTGQTGEVIGTAIARAPNFLRKPQNREILAQFGIDATAPIPEIFQKAFEKARTLSGEELQKLAAAIGGPQYGARVFTGLLQNADKFNQVMREVAPEKAKGSAQRELAKTLATVQERIKRVGVELQQLGGGLAEAGFGSVFILALRALTGMLSVANKVLDVFNELPAPIRQALTMFAQIALIMRGLRRFRLGDTLAARGAPAGVSRFFNEGEDRYNTRLARRGGRDEARFLRDDLVRQTSVRRLAEGEAGRVAAQERAFQQSIRRLPHPVGDDEARAAQHAARAEQIEASKGRLVASEQAALNAAIRQEQLQAELVTVEERNALLAQRRNRVRGAQIAAEARAAIPGSLDFQTGAGPIRPTAIRRDQFGVGFAQQRAERAAITRPEAGDQFGVMAAGANAAEAVATQERREAAARQRMATSKRNMAQQFRAAQRDYPRIGTAGAAAVAAWRGTTQSAYRLAQQVPSWRGAMSRGAGALRNVGAKIGTLIGPMDLALVGGILIFEEISALVEAANREGKRLEGLSSGKTGSASGQARELARARKELERGHTFLDRMNQIDPFRIGDDSYTERQRAAEQTRDTILQQRQRARDAIRQRRPIPLATDRQIDDQVKQARTDFEKGNASLTQTMQALDAAIKGVRASGISQSAQRRRISQIRAAKIDLDPSNRNLFARLSTLADEDLNKVIEDYGAIIEGGRGSGKSIERYEAAITTMMGRLSGRRDRGSQRKLAELEQAHAQAIQSSTQERLQDDLALARGQRQRDAAYQRAGQNVRSRFLAGPRRALSGLARQIASDLKRAGQLEKELQGVDQEGQPGIAGAPGRLLRRGQILEELGSVRKRIRDRKALMRRIQRQLGVGDREAKLILKEIDDARFEEQTQYREAQTNVGQYRRSRGLPRLRYMLRRAQQEVTRAVRHYGRDSKEALTAIANVEQQQEAVIDQQLGLIEARGQYRAAGLEGTRRSRAEIIGVNEQIAFLRANKGDESQIIQLMAQRKDLEADIRRQEKEEARQRKQRIADRRRAEIESIYDLRLARTDDPVKQARLEYNRDRTLRRRLTPLSDRNERRRLRAQELRSQRGLRDAVVDAELEDIRFGAAIGKLTNDQQISALQNLLKTHKMSKDARRRIREQIYQLKHEADQEGQFDLNVGNIRLPTIYEIRRAVQTGRSGRSVTVQNRNDVKVTITDPDAVPAFARSLEGITGAPSSAFGRSAGMR